MRLEDFRQEVAQDYLRVAKRSRRKYYILFYAIIVVFVIVNVLFMVSPVIKDGRPFFAFQYLLSLILIGVVFYFATKRARKSHEIRIISTDEVKIFEGMCTSKKEAVDDGNSFYSINFQVIGNIVTKTAHVSEAIYHSIYVGELLICAQVGSGPDAIYYVCSKNDITLDEYDKISDGEFLQKANPSSSTVGTNDIPVIKASNWMPVAAGLISYFILLPFGMLIIVRLIVFIRDNNINPMNVISELIFTVVFAAGVCFVVWLVSTWKKRRTNWFKELEAKGISEIAKSDTATAYNIYLKYPKKITEKYVCSLNPAVKDMIR